ncbi:MAG: hypothetical protein U0792_10040 [Gemmataceae bacterium]
MNAGGITTFAKHSVISENRLTLVPEGMDMAKRRGRAVPTGAGVVFNTAQPRPGQSLAAVFGVGGIDRVPSRPRRWPGCYPVIAVDVNPDKLDLAKQLGATGISPSVPAPATLFSRIRALPPCAGRLRHRSHRHPRCHAASPRVCASARRHRRDRGKREARADPRN